MVHVYVVPKYTYVYHGTRVHVYVHVYHGTRVPWYLYSSTKQSVQIKSTSPGKRHSTQSWDFGPPVPQVIPPKVERGPPKGIECPGWNELSTGEPGDFWKKSAILSTQVPVASSWYSRVHAFLATTRVRTRTRVLQYSILEYTYVYTCTCAHVLQYVLEQQAKQTKKRQRPRGRDMKRPHHGDEKTAAETPDISKKRPPLMKRLPF
jgi:hypothetical protein